MEAQGESSIIVKPYVEITQNGQTQAMPLETAQIFHEKLGTAIADHLAKATPNLKEVPKQ